MINKCKAVEEMGPERGNRTSRRVWVKKLLIIIKYGAMIKHITQIGI
jgi:hypothetical protein